MSGTFWLSEEQFSKIKPLLPNKPRGVPRLDDRKVLSGIIFACNAAIAGATFRLNMAPPRRFITAINDGLNPGFLSVYSMRWHRKVPKSADFKMLMIDATHVKTHRMLPTG